MLYRPKNVSIRIDTPGFYGNAVLILQVLVRGERQKFGGAECD